MRQFLLVENSGVPNFEKHLNLSCDIEYNKWKETVNLQNKKTVKVLREKDLLFTGTYLLTRPRLDPHTTVEKALICCKYKQNWKNCI